MRLILLIHAVSLTTKGTKDSTKEAKELNQFIRTNKFQVLLPPRRIQNSYHNT